MWKPISSQHKFKLGNRASRTDHRDVDAVKALRLVGAPPQSATVRPFVKIMDQGQLGSCTCNATAQAVHVEEVKDLVAGGKSLEDALNTAEFLSRLYAYYLARTIDGTVGQDAGTEIRNVFRVIASYGYPPESAWPYNDDSRAGAPFTQMPSAESFRLAYDQRGAAEKSGVPLVAYSRILSTGAQRVIDVKLAIAAGHGVAFGTQVPESLCEGDTNNGNPIKPPTGRTPIAGGHAMMIGEYDGDAFGIVNSWGTGFGKDGWFKMDQSYISWNETSDLWVCQKAPLFAGEVKP